VRFYCEDLRRWFYGGGSGSYPSDQHGLWPPVLLDHEELVPQPAAAPAAGRAPGGGVLSSGRRHAPRRRGGGGRGGLPRRESPRLHDDGGLSQPPRRVPLTPAVRRGGRPASRLQKRPVPRSPLQRGPVGTRARGNGGPSPGGGVLRPGPSEPEGGEQQQNRGGGHAGSLGFLWRSGTASSSRRALRPRAWSTGHRGPAWGLRVCTYVC
jgi:hypothetical protein